MEGFLGQIGGWNIHRPTEAGILSFWQDSLSYQGFMANLHDDIFEKSNQVRTYERITVSLFEKITEIPSTGNFSELEACKAIKIEEWSEAQSNQPCGEKAQFNTWNKALEDTSGILAGLVCKGKDDKEACLTVTIWKHDSAHQESARQNPIGREGVKDFDIVIDPTWTVMNGRM